MAKRLAEQEKQKKAQVILLERFAPSFEALTNEQAGRMLKCIFHYKITKQEPDFGDAVLSFFWQDVKHWLDESEAFYNQKCQTNKDNANARWKKNTSSDNANACDCIQTDTNYQHLTPNENIFLAFTYLGKTEEEVRDAMNLSDGAFNTMKSRLRQKTSHRLP